MTAPITSNVPTRMPPMGGDPDLIREYLNTHLWAGYRAQRRPWLRQVEENVRNLAGRQYEVYNDALGEFVNLPDLFLPADERWRRAPVFNWLTQTYFMEALAKLSENAPALGCLPASSDATDAQTASIFQSFFRYQWTQMGMPELVWPLIGWLLTAGQAWLMPRWNPDLGQPYQFYGPDSLQVPQTNPTSDSPYLHDLGENGMPGYGLGDEGQLMQGEQAVVEYLGDLETQVLCPTSVLTPYGPEPKWRKPWYMREYLLSTEDVWTRFGVEVEPVIMRSDDAMLLRMEYSSRYENSGSGSQFFGGWASSMDPNSVVLENMTLVRERWERSSARNPRGRVTIVTNSTMLLDIENPYTIPGVRDQAVIPFICFERPGLPFRQEGATDLENLIPIQRAKNRQLGNAMDQADHNAQPMKIVNANTVPDDQIDTMNTPGATVKVDGDINGAVGYVNPPPLNAAVVQTADLMQHELDRLSASGPNGQGQPVTDKASGELQAQVRFDADRRWGPTLQALGYGWSRFGQCLMDIAAVCLEDQRLLSIAGEDQALDWLQVTPQMFQGRINIYPTPESFTLETRRDKQNRVIEMFRTVSELSVANPALAQQFVEAIQYPDLLRAMRPNAEAYGLAQRQVTEIVVTGQMPPIIPEQDHGTHIAVVTKYMQGLQFRNLPPDRQMALRLYKQFHELAGAQQVVQQSQMQATVQMAAQSPQIAAQAAGAHQAVEQMPPPPTDHVAGPAAT